MARHSLTVIAMKVAIPTWDDRISPVFDAAKHLLVVDFQDDVETARSETLIEGTGLPGRAKRLADLGVSVLICGAISLPLEQMLSSAGVKVIPHTCGPTEEVLRAFVAGKLTERAFLMPGCCRRRRRFAGSGRGGGGNARGRGGCSTQGDFS